MVKIKSKHCEERYAPFERMRLKVEEAYKGGDALGFIKKVSEGYEFNVYDHSPKTIEKKYKFVSGNPEAIIIFENVDKSKTKDLTKILDQTEEELNFNLRQKGLDIFKE